MTRTTTHRSVVLSHNNLNTLICVVSLCRQKVDLLRKFHDYYYFYFFTSNIKAAVRMLQNPAQSQKVSSAFTLDSHKSYTMGLSSKNLIKKKKNLYFVCSLIFYLQSVIWRNLVSVLCSFNLNCFSETSPDAADKNDNVCLLLVEKVCIAG